MPDTAALNIINLNIDSIQMEIISCKTNREQEMHAMADSCTNTNAGEIKNKMPTVKMIKTFQIMQTIQLIISFPLAT